MRLISEKFNTLHAQNRIPFFGLVLSLAHISHGTPSLVTEKSEFFYNIFEPYQLS